MIQMESLFKRVIDPNDKLKDFTELKDLLKEKFFEEDSIVKKLSKLLEEYEKDKDKKAIKNLKKEIVNLFALNESTALIVSLCIKAMTELSKPEKKKDGKQEITSTAAPSFQYKDAVATFMEWIWKTLTKHPESKHTNGLKFMTIKYFVLVDNTLNEKYIQELVEIFGRDEDLR